MKPISPNQVVELKRTNMPDSVIEIFNDEIARTWNGRYAQIKQDGLVARIMEKLEITRSAVFDNHLLDVEDIYRKEGWTVEYDKPGYNETYEATFKFSKSK